MVISDTERTEASSQASRTACQYSDGDSR